MQKTVGMPERVTPGSPVLRGSNQSGMRAHNERLVLSLLRRDGALAKSDIARMSGLSAQTVSVITRGLEQEGLLLRQAPVRGRIGQPSVPLSLSPEGAFFLGLKIGRRSADLVLTDFLGRLRAKRRQVYSFPSPPALMAFVAAALPELTAELAPDQRGRVAGMGIAMPFQLWSWVDYVGASQSEMDEWRSFDIQAGMQGIVGVPVQIQNDATAACGAELTFGTGEKPRDFLYFYFGYFIGGGLVLDGRLFTGRAGNAAGVAPMPVPGPDGRMQRLMTVASLWPLARAMEAAGQSSDQLWQEPEGWCVDPEILSAWLDSAAAGIASATLSATTLLELEAVLIDGWIPSGLRLEIVRRTHAALHSLDLAGISPPVIREGTIGPDARAIGAAAVPLAQRYLLEPGTALLEG